MSERVDVAAIVRAHRQVVYADNPCECCGTEVDYQNDECDCGAFWGDKSITHADHVAAAITAHIGEVLGGLREDVAEAVAVGPDERWISSEHCADAALAVVREALGCPPDALTAPLRADETTEAER